MLETPVFSIRRDRKRRGREERKHDFYLIESVDWVNVIPLTDDDEVVFVDVYRHGIEGPSLEIPGGMIDPEDDSPAAAAAREMREETGFIADELVPLGVVHPNPALQHNRCFHFLGKGARSIGAPSLDETEDIDLVHVPRAEIPRLVEEGRIMHALVVSCFYLFLQKEGGW
jgi:8-oxo-dGTP pyrophosphatase MutT (NUDIX family)